MAMSIKAFIAAITVSVILISIACGMLSVEVAEANPFFMFHLVDQVPGTIPPNITISSPKNNTVYSLDNIIVTFNVDRPQLDGCRGTAIIDVKYTLDGGTTQAFSIWRGNSASNSNAIPEYNTTFTLPSLPTGNHSLTVYAEGVVYVVDLDIFFINSSSTTFFATGTQPNEPSPSLSVSPTPPNYPIPTEIPLPSPSLSPSPSPSPIPTPSLSPTQTPTLVVTVDSPRNETYLSNRIPVSVSASDPNLQIGPQSVAYLLDGGPQVIVGTTETLGMHNLSNSTVLSLPDGSHSLVGVGITWFNGADGVFYSQPVYFTVDTNPLYTGNTLLIIIVGLAIAVVVVGLLVYLAKHRVREVCS